MLLFRHRGKTPSSSPPPGELMTVVVAVALREEEYHVVAAVEGHELETPEAEQRPRLKRLLKTTHLELNGKMCWRKMEHKGECGLYYLAPGVLVVGVTSVAREREPVRLLIPRATPPAGRPWTSLL
jgi:hypothetical protein